MPDSRLACPTEAGDAESSSPRVPRNTARRIGRIPRPGPLPRTDDTPCGQYEKAPGLSSFSPGSTCTSRRPPNSELRIPLASFREVGGNNGQVLPPGSANHVNLPAGIACPQYQAAMATCVLRVVFNDLSPPHDTSYLLHTNHSIRTRHLSDSVGKKQQFLPSGGVDQGRDFAHKAEASMAAGVHSLRPWPAEPDCTLSRRAPIEVPLTELGEDLVVVHGVQRNDSRLEARRPAKIPLWHVS
jgi:hypothetical protein